MRNQSQFIADSMEQIAKSPGIGVGPFDQLQYDVAAADQRSMGNQGVERSTLEFLCQIQKRLCHLEEHLDVSAAPVEIDNLFGGQPRIG